MRLPIYIIVLSISFTSCEKVVDLNLGTNNPTLVIEGNISNRPGPYFVKLAKTVSFAEASVYPDVSNATVIITDNFGQKDTLTYINNGNYKTTTLQGVSGRTYSLTVIAEGKTYNAKSTMPQNVTFDSLKYNPIQFGGTTIHTVIPIFTDPIATGNNYHFVMKINSVLDKTYLVDNDNVTNGQVYARPLFSNDIEIQPGNNVQVEMQSIDVNSYTYYYTLSQAQTNGPGGGTTPTNPPNGISGGALGLFSAYTTQTKSIIIP